MVNTYWFFLEEHTEEIIGNQYQTLFYTSHIGHMDHQNTLLQCPVKNSRFNILSLLAGTGFVEIRQIVIEGDSQWVTGGNVLALAINEHLNRELSFVDEQCGQTYGNNALPYIGKIVINLYCNCFMQLQLICCITIWWSINVVATSFKNCWQSSWIHLWSFCNCWHGNFSQT